MAVAQTHVPKMAWEMEPKTQRCRRGWGAGVFFGRFLGSEVSGCPLGGRLEDLLEPLAASPHLTKIKAERCNLTGADPSDPSDSSIQAQRRLAGTRTRRATKPQTERRGSW